jgi:ubiquinone/menaquinone biosynthesis C-methylase UbiE
MAEIGEFRHGDENNRRSPGGGPLGSASPQGHSEEHFGEQRDFWWNRDFLDLMAERCLLSQASSMADIGCGLCHWSRLLYPYLRPPARFAGVDREPRWVLEGEQQFRRAFPTVPPDLLTFVEGDATNIPLPQNSFDVVTCQTLLMHLPQPMVALREMVRILRPGGLLLCVEPNNLWNRMAFTSLMAEETVEEVVRHFEFWLRYQRGKAKAGAGDENIGDLLPGYFAQTGLAAIKVHQSDRVAALFPPYDSPAQQALLKQDEEWKTSATGPWNVGELRRYVALAGGSEEFFASVFAENTKRFNREKQALAAGIFHAAFGSMTYLVSGRKREAPPQEPADSQADTV